jgi:hypothetical protein
MEDALENGNMAEAIEAAVNHELHVKGEHWKRQLREPMYEFDSKASDVLNASYPTVPIDLVRGAKNSINKAKNALDNILNFINMNKP